MDFTPVVYMYYVCEVKMIMKKGVILKVMGITGPALLACRAGRAPVGE